MLVLTVTAFRFRVRVMVAQDRTGYSLGGGGLLEQLVQTAEAKDVTADFLDWILCCFGHEIFGYDLRRQGVLEIFGHNLVRGPQIEGRYRFRFWRRC